MQHSAELRRCLEECDVAGARKLWRQIAPHLHQPATDHEAEATIHRARTEMAAMIFRLRAYSHRWLVDHGYPSALPDELRPRAERIYPRIAEGVGIAVKVMSELFRPAAPAIMSAMSDAVMDAYADGKTDPGHIKARIMEARRVAIKRLLGTSIAAFFACAFFGVAAAQMPITLFGTSTPHTPVDPDTNSVTLGVQFRSTQAGTIKGVRFYRGAKSSTGYSVGIFDGSSRARLATASVSAEPCASMPCWEEIDFSAPLSIVANKTYISAYFVKGGHYAADVNGLANQVTSGPLVAIANGQAAGGNGVYHYGTSLVVPDSTYQASNYFVDIAFITSAPPPRTLTISANPAAPSLDSASPPGTVVSTLTASWSDGSPFAGSYGFAQPYSNDGGLFTIQGNTVVTAASVSGDGNTVQNITVEATQ